MTSSPPALPIRGVFFDLGGVLIDNTGIGEMLNWLPAGLTLPELSRRWLLSPTARAFEAGQITSPEFVRSLIGEFHLDVEEADLERAFAGWIRGPYPGAIDILDSLRGTVLRTCLSNTNSIHWRRMVDEFEIDRHFDLCIASHQVGCLKPEPEIFQIALERGGLSPNQVLFLDDHEINVEGARAVGMRAQVVRSVEQVRDALEAHQLPAGEP